MCFDLNHLTCRIDIGPILSSRSPRTSQRKPTRVARHQFWLRTFAPTVGVTMVPSPAWSIANRVIESGTGSDSFGATVCGSARVSNPPIQMAEDPMTPLTAPDDSAGIDRSVASPRQGVDRSRGVTVAERGCYSLLVLWLIIGLAVDTRSHRESDSIDSFFTRSHALGYAAGTATSIYLLYLVRRYRSAQRFSLPTGLEAAVAGIGMYVVGGIGDLIWHTKFGVEQQLKILFSPTHLMLMAAMLMLAFGPIRSAWADDEPLSVKWTGLRTMWPQMIAAGCIAAVLNIFLTYASPYEQAIFTTDVPLLFKQFSQFLQISATMAVYAHTVAFFGIMLLMARRWPLPIGSFVVAFLVPLVSMYIYFDWEYRRAMTALLLGAFVCDVLNAVLAFTVGSATRSAARRFRILAFLGPVLFWSTYLLVTKDGDAITWTTEQWTGTILWSGILGLGLSVLLLPPGAPRYTYLD